MSEGFTRKESKEIEEKIERLGWKIEINNLDMVKHNDSVWWYEYDLDLPILSVENKNKKINYLLIADGDIRITDLEDEENHFYFRGGKPDMGKTDKLTEDLIERGEWGDNNWFEIIRSVYNPKSKKYEVDNDLDLVDEPTSGDIKEIVDTFINFLKDENKRSKI